MESRLEVDDAIGDKKCGTKIRFAEDFFQSIAMESKLTNKLGKMALKKD